MADLAEPAGKMAGPLNPLGRARRSPAAIVVALALALIAVIFAVFGFLCWQAFGTTADGAKTKSQAAANIVADDVQWALGGAYTGLQFIAGEPPFPERRSGMALSQKLKPAIELLGYLADIIGCIAEVLFFVRPVVGQRGETALGVVEPIAGWRRALVHRVLGVG